MPKHTTYPTLKAWREAKGFSTYQAAAELGLTQTRYYRFENHITFPRGKVAKRLKEQTGVPVDSLVGAA